MVFTALEEERKARAIRRQRAEKPTPEFLAGRRRFQQALKEQGVDGLVRNQKAIKQRKLDEADRKYNQHVEAIAEETVHNAMHIGTFSGFGPGVKETGIVYIKGKRHEIDK